MTTKMGMVKIDPSLEANTVEDSKMMWTVGNFSRFVRPGYQRVELSGVDNLDGLMASAYVSPTQDKVVIVAVNTSDEVENVSINLEGVTNSATYTTHITNAQHDLALVELEKDQDDYLVPPRSTVTFVGSL